jgi:hypothetical protein
MYHTVVILKQKIQTGGQESQLASMQERQEHTAHSTQHGSREQRDKRGERGDDVAPDTGARQE